MEQCKAQLGFVPDVICLALGTGMTQAGLLCGQSVYDHGGDAAPEIIGLSTAREEAAATQHLINKSAFVVHVRLLCLKIS